MINKNPYEIRLDVLQMAKDMLEKEADLKVSQVAHILQASAQNTDNSELRVNAEYMVNSNLNYVGYNETDLLAKAQVLYSFVSTDTRALRSDSTKESK